MNMIEDNPDGLNACGEFLTELMTYMDPSLAKRPLKKSVTVYQVIKRQILIGHLTRDSAMTEQSLAQDFACSQGTIREALMSLREDGLVERKGYQGTFVTFTRMEEAMMLARLRLTLECDSLSETSLANLTPEITKRLRSLSAAYVMFYGRRDAYACSEIDRALHKTIFALNNMPVLEPTLNRSLLLLHRFALARTQGHLAWRNNDFDPHAEIIDALENGQVEEARYLLSTHIGRFLERLLPDVHASLQPSEKIASA